MAAPQKAGIQIVLAEAGTVSEIEREFAMMTNQRANGAIIFPDAFFLQVARQSRCRRSSIGCRRLARTTNTPRRVA